MNKVYFSDKENPVSWDLPSDTGILNVWIIPRKWWSLNAWKLALDFKRSFNCYFLKEG